jgi:hypothetical protein
MPYFVNNNVRDILLSGVGGIQDALPERVIITLGIVIVMSQLVAA